MLCGRLCSKQLLISKAAKSVHTTAAHAWCQQHSIHCLLIRALAYYLHATVLTHWGHSAPQSCNWQHQQWR
eukprot:8887-Heterococcus_DN1.PRE.2